MLSVDTDRRPPEEPEHATSGTRVPQVGPPPVGSNSRADVVRWWRWRYQQLEVQNFRLENLLVSALDDAQTYRTILQAALVALHDLTGKTQRQTETLRRLRGDRRAA